MSDHLHSSGMSDPGICDCGEPLPIVDLSAFLRRDDPPMTVTVDLEDNPTLVGWLMSDE